jgi:CheY-like chemotaxis protein
VPNPPAKRRILVAEDNDSARLILADLLRMLGYQVDEVAHGLAAVEAVRAQRYDMVLMDCHMPVLDGLDATRQIRRGECAERAGAPAAPAHDDRALVRARRPHQRAPADGDARRDVDQPQPSASTVGDLRRL